MPRRGRSASPPPAPRRAAPAPASRVPAPAPAAAAVPMTAQAQQPSMFSQMAATAGGVAVGSAVVKTTIEIGWDARYCVWTKYEDWQCEMCTRCGGGRRGNNYRRSGYSRAERSAPSRPPTILVQPVPRRSSVFRDAAAVAGGVTVGTAMGHVAGEAITSLFSGPRRHEVQQVVPRDFDHSRAPTGPCAYEIATFLQCATNHANLTECQAFSEALKDCKERNGIP